MSEYQYQPDNVNFIPVNTDVFVMYKNKIVNTHIRSIHITVDSNRLQMFYKLHVEENQVDIAFYPDQVFKTKEDLIKSL